MLDVVSNSADALSNILEPGGSLIIDEGLAQRLLEECPYAGQRPLNQDRALLLASAMEHGTFLQNTQIAFCRLGGAYVLVNGQHRLNAVALARQAQRFRIEVYDSRSAAEVDATYCRFDQPGGQRSLSQVSMSLGLHDEGEEGLRPSTAALLLRAVPLLMVDLRRIPPNQRPRITRDLDAKKEFALKWKACAIAYQQALGEGIASRTARYRAGGVFAVALVTFKYQNEKARRFWADSIRDSGLLGDDPRHALHSHFLASKRASSEYDLAEAACNAWNAFFQGRKLTVCKMLGSPLRIAGTPFQGDD